MQARTVLADDHSLVREALRNLLESHLPGLKIVGEAATSQEAMDLCRKHRPDLLVLDLSMPDVSGLEVLAEMKRISQDTKVAIVSQYTDRAYVIRALRLGAKAYVPKKAMATDLVGAIRAVLAGQTYVDPSVADVVVDAAMNPDESGEPDELARMTERERSVFRLTAEGKTAKEIAKVLGISQHTVNRHRANLMEKLDIHSKAELIKLAVRLKVIKA